MPLIDRLTRAVGADLHALLDRLEDPATLLRQALREMSEETERGAAALEAMEARIEAREGRLDTLEQRRAALDRSIDLCLAEGREDLARKVVRDKLGNRARQEAEAAALAEDRRAREQLAATLAERRETLTALHERASAIEPAAQHHPTGDEAPIAGTVREADVEVALLAEIAARRAS